MKATATERHSIDLEDVLEHINVPSDLIEANGGGVEDVVKTM